MDIDSFSKPISKKLSLNQNSVFIRLSPVKLTQRSSSTESSIISFPVFQQLQKKIVEYDELGFPKLEMPSTSSKKRPKRLKNSQPKFEKQEFIPPLVLKFGGTTENHFHQLSATATFDTERKNIGPGTYKAYEKPKISGGFISGTPRFQTTCIEFAEFFIENKH